MSFPEVDYEKVPTDHMVSAVQRYYEYGCPPGSFLTAVIENDPHRAAYSADATNKEFLVDWFEFFANEMPQECYGSPKALNDWCNSGGKNGRK